MFKGFINPKGSNDPRKVPPLDVISKWLGLIIKRFQVHRPLWCSYFLEQKTFNLYSQYSGLFNCLNWDLIVCFNKCSTSHIAQKIYFWNCDDDNISGLINDQDLLEIPNYKPGDIRVMCNIFQAYWCNCSC